MSENPYKTPESAVDPRIQLSEFEAQQLEKLAVGQKIVIFAILAYFIAVIVRPAFPLLTFIIVIACLITSLVGLFQVVKVLKLHIALKVLYFIALFIPLINILALASINARATKTLKAGGYKVGLLGARKQAT